MTERILRYGDGLECRNCVFYDDVRTVCRRSAPKLLQLSDTLLRTAWPSVATFDWCGEHTLRMTQKETEA